MIPDFQPGSTYADILPPAMNIARRGDHDEAQQFMDAYAAYLREQKPRWTDEQIDATIKSNLGYYAGYYGPDTRDAVRDVFGALHPIFGDHHPTPEEAFEAGQRMARGE